MKNSENGAPERHENRVIRSILADLNSGAELIVAAYNGELPAITQENAALLQTLQNRNIIMDTVNGYWLNPHLSRLINYILKIDTRSYIDTDIAARLATNRTYVSAIIKSLSGDSFSTLVNGYRVRYAQKLMQEHPKMSVTEIAEESGFSSRSAFYRNFKDITGLSPAEWKRAARESRP